MKPVNVYRNITQHPRRVFQGDAVLSSDEILAQKWRPGPWSGGAQGVRQQLASGPTDRLHLHSHNEIMTVTPRAVASGGDTRGGALASGCAWSG